MLRFFSCVLWLVLCGFLVADEPAMRLRLKEGSFAAGQIVAVDQPHQLGWRSASFAAPFRFDVRAVRAVSSMADGVLEPATPASDEARGARQFIELANGGMVAGQIVDITDQWLTVRSAVLGEVQIARSAATAIVDAAYAGQIIYSGPIDDEHWQRLTAAEDWEFEAGTLVATKQGAAVVGNVGLPAQSQINLALSWRGAPDFVLSLGTSANNKISKVEEVPSAARLEVWANQLALVREVEGGADIAMLSDLSDGSSRIDLTIYLDQEAGTVVVCDKHGRPMETLKVPSDKAMTRPSVHLANSGPSLTIEHFEVRKWDGLTSSLASDQHAVLDADGQNHSGAAIVGLDAEQQALRVALENGEQILLPLEKLRRGDLAHLNRPAGSDAQSTDSSLPPEVVQPPQLNADQNANGQRAPLTEPAASADPLRIEKADGHDATGHNAADDTQIEVVLLDRTRLRGNLLPADDPKILRMSVNDLADPVQFPCAAVRGLIGNSVRFMTEDGEQVVGTLKAEDLQLAGYLDEPPDAEPATTQLYWHPSGSLNASGISPAASGAIIYRKPLPTQITGKAAAEPGGNRMRVLAPAVGMFLGNAARDRNSTQPVQPNDASTPPAREIMFRTGDAIDGIVQQIDEQGMTFASSQTSTTRAPHELIQHVWLNRTRDTRETSAEKLKRLMTVPRSMKNDPPTHLFIAINGDYLRGRLVKMEGDRLTIEVRLDQVEIPTSQIAQIIWLHDRDWSEKQPPASEPGDTAIDPAGGDPAVASAVAAKPAGGSGNAREEEFLVHAIGRNDRGLTFRPEELDDGILSGHSDLLGECSVAVSELNQLLFGRDITQQVRAFRTDPWTLSLAQLPRVYMDDGSGAAGSAGMDSSMVGKPAPDFLLKSIEGAAFRLSKNHERVVILDFWASWCGPCIQTMPLVEEVVNELGADKVHLVAVNIQETEARARAAVERLNMSATVLLDIDGQAAAAYMANAIPQTVIIDRQGNVTHVFVGGGPKFVEQLRQALQTQIEAADTSS